MDSDRILVLSDGKVVEFDTPHTLLSDADGVLMELATQTGEESRNKLVQLARLASQVRRENKLF